MPQYCVFVSFGGALVKPSNCSLAVHVDISSCDLTLHSQALVIIDALRRKIPLTEQLSADGVRERVEASVISSPTDPP